MNKEEIIDLILEWQGLILKRQGIEREIENSLYRAIGSKPIKIITGFRRSGKSFVTQRIGKRCIEEGNLALSNLLYLNLEDFRLGHIHSTHQLNELYECFRSDVAQDGKKLLIFDEIQLIPDWEKWIRTLYERDEDIEMILTGSNSEMLSSELGSRLAGRYISFFILPFNFRETLRFHNEEPTSLQDYRRNRRLIDQRFADYLKYGGLPEAFKISDVDAKYSYLEGILTKVILDDIVKRFRVDNVLLLEKLMAYLFSNIGNAVSYNRLKNLLKGFGIHTKPETIIKYIDYLVKSFALFDIAKFDWKLNKLFSTSKKYFAIDFGILSLYRAVQENYSYRLENLVYLHLKQKGHPTFYGMNAQQKEIDFLIQSPNQHFLKIQVCQELTDQNYQREVGNLILSDPHLQKGTSLLLTLKTIPKLAQKLPSSIKHELLIEWLLFETQTKQN